MHAECISNTVVMYTALFLCSVIDYCVLCTWAKCAVISMLVFVQDDCIGCCLGNTFYGLTWPSTAQMTTARLSCSLIHPSFAQNSFVERECSLQRFNDSVNFRNCVFNPDAMTNLLLYTAILPDSSGAGIANATRSAQDVRGQVMQLQTIDGLCAPLHVIPPLSICMCYHTVGLCWNCPCLY